MKYLSQVLDRPFVAADLDNLKIPQAYVNQKIKFNNEFYYISAIDSNGNISLTKITDMNDLMDKYNLLNNAINAEKNTRAAQIGALDNIDSTLDNSNLVAAINSLMVANVLNYIEIADDYTISNPGQFLLVDTSDKAITVTLPSNPVNGYKISIKDFKNNADNNNITVDGNSNNINDDSNLIIDIEGAKVDLMYYGDQWIIVN